MTAADSLVLKKTCRPAIVLERLIELIIDGTRVLAFVPEHNKPDFVKFHFMRGNL